MFEFAGTLPGPWNIAFAGLIAVTVFLTYRGTDPRLRTGGHAFVISLLAAWIATYIGPYWFTSALLAVVMGICAAMCIRARHAALTAVAALYAPRIIFLAANQIGWLDDSTMWAWTEVPLTLQILIVIGAVINGGVRAKPDGIDRLWNVGGSGARRHFGLSTRLPHSPHSGDGVADR